MFGKLSLNDSYESYYGTETKSYSVFDVFRAIAIMFMPPFAFIRNVMTLVKLLKKVGKRSIGVKLC